MALIIFILFLISIPRQAVLAASPNSPMGTTSRLEASLLSLAKKEEVIRLMAEAGVAWDRIFINSNFVINPSGTINTSFLTDLDQLLELYNKYDIHVYMMIFNQSEYIGYSGNACTDIQADPMWPNNLWHSPPKNLSRWNTFVKTLVNRYQNDVKYWEISFEENSPGCQFAIYPNRYIAFLKNTADTIHTSDPQAKIILGRLLPNNNIPYFKTLMDNHAGQYFDIVSIGGPYLCDTYSNAATWISTIRTITNKPIWLTEAECDSDVQPSPVDGISDPAGHSVQKTFIRELYRQGLSAGAQKIFYHTLIDRNDFPKIENRMSGILSTNGSTFSQKPSYSAYQQAARDAGFPQSLTPKPTSTSSLSADFNHDGNVDVLDYSVWYSEFIAGNHGKVSKNNWYSDATGLNGVPDTKVDIYDYSLWLSAIQHN